jgi:hypothetical protein
MARAISGIWQISCSRFPVGMRSRRVGGGFGRNREGAEGERRRLGEALAAGEDRHHRLLAGGRQAIELDPAVEDHEEGVRRIALEENRRAAGHRLHRGIGEQQLQGLRADAGKQRRLPDDCQICCRMPLPHRTHQECHRCRARQYRSPGQTQRRDRECTRQMR